MRSFNRRGMGFRITGALALLISAVGCGGAPAEAVEPGAEDLVESSADLSLVTPLARTQGLATELEVDATNVYWVELGSPGSPGKSQIMKRSKSAFALGLPQQLVSQDGSIYDLMADAYNLYWFNQTYENGEMRVSVHRVSKFGGAVATLSAVPADSHAWTSDEAWLYVATGEGIARVSKSSGAREVIATSAEQIFLNLFVDASHVYWTNYLGIFRAPKTGGATTQLVTESVNGFVLSGSDLYYVPYREDALRRVSKSGGTATTVLQNFRPSSQWGTGTHGMAFTVSGSTVIWLDAYGSSEWDQGRVMKASLLTGLRQTIALAQPGLAKLAVDSMYVYWTSIGTFTNEWPPEHNRDGAVFKALR